MLANTMIVKAAPYSTASSGHQQRWPCGQDKVRRRKNPYRTDGRHGHAARTAARAFGETPRHLGTSDCLPACLALARARGPQRKPCGPRVGGRESSAAHAPAPRGFGAVLRSHGVLGVSFSGGLLADSPRFLVFLEFRRALSLPLSLALSRFVFPHSRARARVLSVRARARASASGCDFARVFGVVLSRAHAFPPRARCAAGRTCRRGPRRCARCR